MTTFEELVRVPRLKIERAKHHIRDVHQQIEAYVAEKPMRLVIEHNPKLNQRIIRIKADKPIPENISLTIGDAIHNLRSALDVLMFGMVGDKAPKPQSVQFPFASNAENLQGEMSRRFVRLAGIDVVKRIEGLKPYSGGGKYLSALHSMDISDKHKLIIAVAKFPAFKFQDLFALDPELLGRTPPYGAQGTVVLIPHGDVIYHYPVKADVAGVSGGGEPFIWKESVVPSTYVTFADGQPFSGERISLIFVNLSSYVSEIVNDLANDYIRTQS